ncbi:MAG: RNA polymerase sigma factor [Planctomycetota bacterium]
MSDDDASDIQAALGGDDDAFRRLVERYEAPIARLMWRFARDTARCEELTQDVFVEAYRSLNTYRAEAPFLHWLRRIGTRVGYRFWRRRSKREDHLPLAGIVDPADRDRPPEAAEAGRILHALLARLPPDDRLVLTLEYFEQCSMKEIAEQTGWTEDAAKMRAHRAREKLREIAERENLVEALGWTS